MELEESKQLKDNIAIAISEILKMSNKDLDEVDVFSDMINILEKHNVHIDDVIESLESKPTVKYQFGQLLTKAGYNKGLDKFGNITTIDFKTSKCLF